MTLNKTTSLFVISLTQLVGGMDVFLNWPLNFNCVFTVLDLTNSKNIHHRHICTNIPRPKSDTLLSETVFLFNDEISHDYISNDYIYVMCRFSNPHREIDCSDTFKFTLL